MDVKLSNILEKVREIILKGLKEYHVKIFLFGSQARGQARRTSDIDIIIQPLEPLPHGVLSIIREELEESNIPYSVDLVDISQLGPEWIESIKKDWVLWKG